MPCPATELVRSPTPISIRARRLSGACAAHLNLRKAGFRFIDVIGRPLPDSGSVAPREQHKGGGMKQTPASRVS